jgi:hypothetical protein
MRPDTSMLVTSRKSRAPVPDSHSSVQVGVGRYPYPRDRLTDRLEVLASMSLLPLEGTAAL